MRWEQYKLSFIQKNKWTECGRLANLCKSFFLLLAASAVDYVNRNRDTDGLAYERKSKIMCGIALSTNGKWEERQLKPELQNIIKNHQFQSKNPAECDST